MSRCAVIVLCVLAACTKQERPDEPMHDAEHAMHAAPNTDRSLGGWAPEFKDVQLKLVEPQPGQVYPAGATVNVSWELRNYPLAQPGPHIHLIVDDQPYVAVYDASTGHALAGLSPGAHVIRSFPSRPWHESIKSSPGAFAAARFVIGQDDGKYPVDLSAPLFTYSRPKGEYAGEDAKKIMFDWYLRNVELSEGGYRVRWVLDGAEHFATKWEPIWWDGLAPGEHTLAAGLVDASGKVVDNAGLNWTQRKFTVKETP
jgi:hypothetical protein